MENAVGIEAARARLGDIADNARTTGQVTRLTRHGRTVAVIGPANSIKPAGGVEVTLYFPHTERTCVLPALPHTGETLIQDVELSPEESDEATWRVTEVQWHMSANGDMSVGVSLDPNDDRTKRLMQREEDARIAALRARNTTTTEK